MFFTLLLSINQANCAFPIGFDQGPTCRAGDNKTVSSKVGSIMASIHR